MFYAVKPVRYRDRRSFGCPEMGTWGLYSEFGIRHDQNHPRNEFPDHENMSKGTLIEILGAIVSVLCSYTSEISVFMAAILKIDHNGHQGCPRSK